MQAPVRVAGLRKSYGQVEAVRGLDFHVAEGEVFGLLGPNGAGKTTVLEILEGLRTRSSGDVSVLGVDPESEFRSLRKQIGVCLQATNLPDKLLVREALDWFGSFYPTHADREHLLQRLHLSDKRDCSYSSLSGGQKQRLALALALVNEPRLLFLDEPTKGLDPQVRLEIHTLVEELRQGGCTILLTTHYIEEAERLCDRVAIVDGGEIVAMDTPRVLQQQTSGQARIEASTSRPMPLTIPAALRASKYMVGEDRKSLVVYSACPANTLVALVKWIDQHDFGLDDVRLRRPSLEDVFIELTGKQLRD